MGKRLFYVWKDEKGYYTMLTVIGVATLLTIIGSSLIYLTNQDVRDVKRDELRAKALQVAEAGVSSYLWKLNQDRTYYQTTSDSAELNWVPFQDGDYRLSVSVPGGRPGVLLTSTGRVPNNLTNSYIQRQIMVRIEKKSFAQYIYVTDNETVEGTGQRIWFISGDTIRGPLHSNDTININGNPVFEGKVTTARNLNIAGGNPVFRQGYETGVPPLELPTSNQELKAWAQQDGYYYYGETNITLLSNGYLQISNQSALSQGPTGLASLPSNGVIFVDGQAGAKWNPTNGDAYIQGVLSGNLTIGAKNNIYITGDITYNNDQNDMLGLVAENYVYINHYNRYNNDVAPYNVTVEAAIFALNHSFGFERYNQGSAKGTLTVKGTIAQRYRGAVGTFSGGSRLTGYAKNYWYDERMKYDEPPHFVEPLNAGFEITDWQETKSSN